MMAAAQRGKPAGQVGTVSARMALARRAWPDALAALLVAAVVFAFFGHAFLNYDSFYALVWGDDLAHGRTPQFDAPVAPTPHPLANLIGLILSPLGDTARETAFLVIVLIAVGALVVGIFRLGQVLFSVPVGVLAALIVATRVPLLNYGVRGYVDLMMLAFVVWAAVLEARRPRRGAAPPGPPRPARPPPPADRPVLPGLLP